MNPKADKSPILIAFLIILLDVIGFGMLIPVQPFYAQQFGATPAAITHLGTIYAAMQFIFAPLWGAISDRFGRRKVLLSTIIVTGLGHLLFAWANSLTLLFLARALTGLGAANLSTAQAVVADVSAPESRAKNMGKLGAAFGIGFVIGPGLGGWLSQVFPELPAYFAALFAVLNWFLVLKLLPETRPAVTSPHPRLGWTSLKNSFNYSVNVRWCLFITFLSTIAFSLMEHTISLYLQSIWAPISLQPVEEGSRLSAIFLSVVGVSSAVVQGGLVGRLSKTFRESQLMVLGLGILSIAMCLVPILGGIGSFLLFQLAGMSIAFGSGLLSPSSAAYLASQTNENEQAFVHASNQASNSLGRIIGTLIAGALFMFSSSLPYLVASAIFLSLTFIALKVLAKK
jgi:multidrug resistance protein